MLEFFKILSGLALVMMANVVLGINLATIKKCFCKKKCKKGILKSLLVLLAIALMYFCGYLNPSIVVANINGINVDLMEGVHLILVAGIIFYGYQDLNKLSAVLKSKVSVEEVQESNSVVISKENEIKVEK